MAKRATTEQRRMYAEFVEDFPFCWVCGWSEGFREHGRSELHCAHIVGGSGRRHDRRDLWRACEVCHCVSHGETRKLATGEILPAISLSNVVWLKKIFDCDHFDLEYLKCLRIKRAEPIVPEPLVEMYRRLFKKNVGVEHSLWSNV